MSDKMLSSFSPPCLEIGNISMQVEMPGCISSVLETSNSIEFAMTNRRIFTYKRLTFLLPIFVSKCFMLLSFSESKKRI